MGSVDVINEFFTIASKYKLNLSQPALHDLNVEHQILIKRLHKSNILARELWKPMHLLPMFKSMPRTRMKNSINNWKTGLSLPSSYYK